MRTGRLAAASAIAGIASVVGCSIVVSDVSDLVGVSDAGVTATDHMADTTDRDTAADGAPSLDDGLMGRWAFDEDGGTIANDALGKNPGTFIGPILRVAGRKSPALRFNGTFSYVDIKENDSLIAPETLTVAAWVKLSEATYDQYIYTHAYVFQVRLNGRNPRILCGSGYTVADYSLPVGQWHHLAVTFDRGAVAFYVDGRPVPVMGGTLKKGDPLGGTWWSSVKIGCAPDATACAIGELDDVRLWRRALSSSDVAALID